MDPTTKNPTPEESLAKLLGSDTLWPPWWLRNHWTFGWTPEGTAPAGYPPDVPPTTVTSGINRPLERTLAQTFPLIGQVSYDMANPVTSAATVGQAPALSPSQQGTARFVTRPFINLTLQDFSSPDAMRHAIGLRDFPSAPPETPPTSQILSPPLLLGALNLKRIVANSPVDSPEHKSAVKALQANDYALLDPGKTIGPIAWQKAYGEASATLPPKQPTPPPPPINLFDGSVQMVDPYAPNYVDMNSPAAREALAPPAVTIIREKLTPEQANTKPVASAVINAKLTILNERLRLGPKAPQSGVYQGAAQVLANSGEDIRDLNSSSYLQYILPNEIAWARNATLTGLAQERLRQIQEPQYMSVQTTLPGKYRAWKHDLGVAVGRGIAPDLTAASNQLLVGDMPMHGQTAEGVALFQGASDANAKAGENYLQRGSILPDWAGNLRMGGAGALEMVLDKTSGGIFTPKLGGYQATKTLSGLGYDILSAFGPGELEAIRTAQGLSKSAGIPLSEALQAVRETERIAAREVPALTWREGAEALGENLKNNAIGAGKGYLTTQIGAQVWGNEDAKQSPDEFLWSYIQSLPKAARGNLLNTLITAKGRKLHLSDTEIDAWKQSAGMITDLYDVLNAQGTPAPITPTVQYPQWRETRPSNTSAPNTTVRPAISRSTGSAKTSPVPSATRLPATTRPASPHGGGHTNGGSAQPRHQQATSSGRGSGQSAQTRGGQNTLLNAGPPPGTFNRVPPSPANANGLVVPPGITIARKVGREFVDQNGRKIDNTRTVKLIIQDRNIFYVDGETFRSAQAAIDHVQGKDKPGWANLGGLLRRR